jgi:hypothetical protein
MLAMVAAGVTGAAAKQGLQPSNEPGHPSPPRVWINNHDPSEAIPVTITSATRIALVPDSVVRTRPEPVGWLYRSVTVPADADVATAIAPLGAQGWDAVGLTAAPRGTGIVVLLKHPQ